MADLPFRLAYLWYLYGFTQIKENTLHVDTMGLYREGGLQNNSGMSDYQCTKIEPCALVNMKFFTQINMDQNINLLHQPMSKTTRMSLWSFHCCLVRSFGRLKSKDVKVNQRWLTGILSLLRNADTFFKSSSVTETGTAS